MGDMQHVWTSCKVKLNIEKGGQENELVQEMVIFVFLDFATFCS